MRAAISIALLGAVVTVAPLTAQGGPSTLNFSFSNPGARSLGMGGAFAALADDATAAFSNPAGLIQLSRPEVSVEGRYWEYSSPFTVSGRVSGEATGIGLDTSLRAAESEFDTSALSFLSFVYPARNWTLALSQHQLAKFEFNTATQGLFTDDPVDGPQPTCLPGTVVCRYPEFRRNTRIEMATTTLSVALRGSDKFSMGLGLSYHQADLRLSAEQYTLAEETLPLGFFGPNDYAPGALYGRDSFESDDTDWAFNLGFLWFISRQWSLGGFYRSAPEAGLDGERRSGPALDPPIPTGTLAGSVSDVTFHFPEVYGLGLAYRSRNGSWTAGFEWDRVQYSTILESIPDNDLITVDYVFIDDADELRLGGEYAFRQLQPIVALRAGLWKDPDHQVRTTEDDPLEQALLPRGTDELHYSLGVGVAFKNFQTDIALDLSDQVNTAAISLIYAF